MSVHFKLNIEPPHKLGATHMHQHHSNHHIQAQDVVHHHKPQKRKRKTNVKDSNKNARYCN